MRETMPTPDKREKREAMQTENPYEAIVAIADEQPVTFTYSHHYGCYINFDLNGKVSIDDEGRSYELTADRKGSIDDDARKMMQAAETVKKAKMAVPAGNMKNFGGIARIAQNVLDTLHVEEYIRGFETMTPDEQERYRQTMSDKRK